MIVRCPHCSCYVDIIEVNCGIFRHCIYKDGKQFYQHSTKELCDTAIEQNLVYGCGKPFRIIDGNVTTCDYI